MKYVSKIVDYCFEEVFWSDFQNIEYIEITDEDTGTTEKYSCQGFDKRNFTDFSNIYGVELEWGIFLTRPIDLKLYECIDLVAVELLDNLNITFNIESPIDKNSTLFPCSNRFSGTSPCFTLGQVVYSKLGVIRKFLSPVEVVDDKLIIRFKPARLQHVYKILDMKKFNNLITKYKTLYRE